MCSIASSVRFMPLHPPVHTVALRSSATAWKRRVPYSVVPIAPAVRGSGGCGIARDVLAKRESRARREGHLTIGSEANVSGENSRKEPVACVFRVGALLKKAVHKPKK